MTQAITATGLKGFLQWLQQDQPAVYTATAAKIAKAVPKGFSGFNGSVLQAARLRVGRRSMALRGYGALGCCAAAEPAMSAVGTCATLATPNFCITDTSCAANSGVTCASSLSGVASIINSVTSAALTAQQQSQYNTLLQTQLSRASTGLSPLTLSSSAAGVPLIPGLSSSGSTVLLLGGAAVLLYLLFGRRA
jgi:hypothetical protein